MKNENLVPKVRFKGFSDPWEQRKLKWFLRVSKLKNIDGIFDKNSVLSVSGEFGVVNQIAFQGRSFAGKSILNYGILDHNDVVYTKSPLKSNPYGIIKTNLGKAGVVSTLYAVYAPLKTVYSPILGYYFNLDTRVNNYLRPLVNKGAKNDMKVRDEAVLEGKVCIPDSIETQKRICNLFSLIDNLIAANEDKLEQLKTLKKLMMQKIFSQKWRFKGFTDPWEQRKLGELSNGFTYGLNASAKAYDGKHQYLRITDIDDETRTFKQTHLTSPDIDFIRDNSYVLKLGDIVFTRTGASTGKTFIYRTADSIVYYAGFLIKMSVREDIDSEFVFQNTLTTSFNRFVKVMSQRSGQPGINSKEYARFKLYIPKLKEQVLVGNMLLLIDNLIAANEDKLNQLKKLKKYLMQNMFV